VKEVGPTAEADYCGIIFHCIISCVLVHDMRKCY